MTRCRFSLEIVSAALDHALDPDEQREFDAHLPCEECHTRRASLAATRRALRTLPDRIEPAGAVRARVEALRFAASSPRWYRRRVTWIVALTGVIAAGVVALAMGRADSSQHAADLLVADHLRSVPEVRPAEISSDDPRTVAAFFDGHVSFPATAPELPNSKLLGGRLCRVEGKLTELLFYQREERVLSLFVAGDSLGVDGCRSVREHSVCSARRGGLTLTLVGALPPRDVQRLLDRARL